jgi:hypothetical protein
MVRRKPGWNLSADKAEKITEQSSSREVVLFNEAPHKCPYDPEKIQLKFGVPLEFQVIRPLGFNLP